MSVCGRFPRAARILRPSEFDGVFATRASAAAEGLVLHAGRNDVGVPRLGVSVSRRVGNAVVRNGWKRRLREAFRRIRADLPVADYVVVVKSRVVPRGAAGASRVERTLAALATQAVRRCGHAGGTNR